MVHADSQFSANTKQDIKHTFQLPQVINGIYDFTPFGNRGTQFQVYQEFSTVPDLLNIPPLPGKRYYFFDSYLQGKYLFSQIANRFGVSCKDMQYN